MANPEGGVDGCSAKAATVYHTAAAERMASSAGRAGYCGRRAAASSAASRSARGRAKPVRGDPPVRYWTR